MAQIHALLISTPHEMTAEEIMDRVKISRGNANINLRELNNWRLVAKVNKLGERKEFFKADHDIWSMARNIVIERKKRELEPVMRFLNHMESTDFTGNEVDIAHFKNLVSELKEFVQQLDKLSEMSIRFNDNVVFKKMIKMMQ
ncbi:MAG: transcriptional regulator [Cryomorphaceae bacterium]